MSSRRDTAAIAATAPEEVPATVFDGRAEFARSYLAGEGLEIGALHLPTAIPAGARARYVDRMTAPELRSEYPELATFDLVEVDVIDDGEALNTVAEESQDFIIANHFLEHCEDPIGTIGTHLSKLRPGGVLFYAVPDKRYTFDFRRQVTPIEHMVDDHENGPERSRRQHYREWAGLVQSGDYDPLSLTEEQVEASAEDLDRAGYSIHMHVWTQAEFLRLILKTREIHDESFDIEATAKRGIEFMVILRKHGPPPRPVGNGAGGRQATAAASPKPLPDPLRRLAHAMPPGLQRFARRGRDRLTRR